MEGLVERNLGLVMAYFVPGFVGLLCVQESSVAVQHWFGAAEGGSWLPLLLASLACGMVTSAVRWAVLDWAHAATGLSAPALRLENLEARLAAFEAVIHNHYRYYQGYGNLLVAFVAGVGVFGAWPVMLRSQPVFSLLTYFGVVITLFAASRDCLRKAYTRSSELLSSPDTRNDTMTNGWPHGTEKPSAVNADAKQPTAENKAASAQPPKQEGTEATKSGSK